MLLTHRRLGPKSDVEKTARIIHSAQRTFTRSVKFPTLTHSEFQVFNTASSCAEETTDRKTEHSQVTSGMSYTNPNPQNLEFCHIWRIALNGWV